MKQLRGGYSEKIKQLRESLMNFAALIELELDFSQEDVEFADRSQLRILIEYIVQVVNALLESFSLGNAIKNGIPVTIVGKPNAGKSTLLNTLLKEERAIVSEIEGTTRDTIEDELVIDGISFRFIDTAGLRQTTDTIENLGIDRSYAKMREADVILYLFDARSSTIEEVQNEIRAIQSAAGESKQIIPIGNKVDELNDGTWEERFSHLKDAIPLSAKLGTGIEQLQSRLIEYVSRERVSETLVTNARHAQALKNASISLNSVLRGLDLRIPGDLLSSDIRDALNSLAEITGEVSSDEVLGVIFGKFCIGK
jgi:tRNA modification GTPase